MLHEIPKIVVEETDYAIDQYMISKLMGTVHIKFLADFSKKFGLENEINGVLDDLWDINKDVQQYAYPEPRLFFWDGFEYGKDGWRKLMEVVNRHGGQTLFDMKEMPIDGLLNKDKDSKG
jgi:hypothetical protein